MAYTTINKSSLHMNTKLYTGNQTARSITGVGFQPDLVWIKPYTNGAWSHNLTDSVRGAGYGLFADLNNTQYNYGTGTDGSVRTFDSDGFSIGTATQVNNNSSNIVAWNWKAGGGQGSSNTDGDINTTYTSVNTTAGFSISTYTGNGGSNQSLGHGLGATPKIYICKRRDNTGQWVFNTTAIDGSLDYLFLENSNAKANSSRSLPTSSVVYLENGGDANESGGTHVCYAFTEKQGFSKFGSYTGNGSEGAFIYTGFAPSFFMIKRTDGSGDKWRMWDSVRSPFNVVDDSLAANENSVEYDDVSVSLDFLSNGVKMKMTGGGAGNGNNETYVFMAFGQSIVGTNNLPSNAK